ncbi:serine/threonine protein kinase [Actinomadura rubrisoli]|uniref:Protein kinase domain-containing protein n=1 Tax=Actinomadura rubrisoli TaxID=2530368 RepID=A0A4R5CGU3_9ACTN|nr:protein kinase [Actinomadura rubrisoli]TDD97710.1 hypothetical protein E1298_01350 [Actinomadura rubrisoli]
MTAQPPDAFGDYRVTKLLGRGMEGETFLAVDPSGREVAIKTIHLEEVSSRKAGRALDREVVALRSINWAYAPKFIGYHPKADRPYYAMEYIEGITVDDAIALTGGLGDVEAQRLAVRLAAILAALHTAGVAHGDFRGQNLIISKDGGIYVVDFGRATLRCDSRQRFRQRRDSDLRQFGELIVFARNGRSAFGKDSSLAIERYNEGRPDLGALSSRARTVAAELLRKPGRGRRRPSARRVHRVLVHGRRGRWRFGSGIFTVLVCVVDASAIGHVLRASGVG